MIPLIEDHLVDALVSKFSYLKANPQIVSNIISTTPSRSDRLKLFIQGTPVKVIKGFPRTPAELPCLCVVLAGEEETQETLGDTGEDDDYSILPNTETVQLIPNSESTPVPHVQLSHFPLVNIQQITNSDGDIIPAGWYSASNYDRGIVNIYDGVELGESVTVTYTYRKTSLDLVQVMYESNYRIEAWAAHADLTVDLYHLAKWALLSSRSKLINDTGLFRQRLGGADFSPATSYFPEFVYRRALTFWCQFSSSVPDIEVPYISSVGINQTIVIDTK